MRVIVLVTIMRSSFPVVISARLRQRRTCDGTHQAHGNCSNELVSCVFIFVVLFLLKTPYIITNLFLRHHFQSIRFSWRAVMPAEFIAVIDIVLEIEVGRKLCIFPWHVPLNSLPFPMAATMQATNTTYETRPAAIATDLITTINPSHVHQQHRHL